MYFWGDREKKKKKKTRAVRAERHVHLHRPWRKVRGPSQVTVLLSQVDLTWVAKYTMYMYGDIEI